MICETKSLSSETALQVAHTNLRILVEEAKTVRARLLRMARIRKTEGERFEFDPRRVTGRVELNKGERSH